jgi:4a-hydroxytetrahydrobiopterin dehydratase
MSLLKPERVEEALRNLPGWKVEKRELVRTFNFPDFVSAMKFVNTVAEKAEAAGHHPDIDIRYNEVRLALVSHDAGGLTERDTRLAEVLQAIE